MNRKELMQKVNFLRDLLNVLAENKEPLRVDISNFLPIILPPHLVIEFKNYYAEMLKETIQELEELPL